jgi:hypothetical protein
VAERHQLHKHSSTCYKYLHPLIKQYGARILHILLRERKVVRDQQTALQHKVSKHKHNSDVQVVKKRKVTSGTQGGAAPPSTKTTTPPTNLRKVPQLCRFNLPADLVPVGHMDITNHVMRLPRDNAYVNGYNPDILVCLRNNMDIKWIGADLVRCLAKARYMTAYATKGDSQAHELFTVMSAGLTRLQATNQLPTDTVQRAHKVLGRCYMSLGSLQEVSGPMMAALMLNLNHQGGDHYKSSRFATVYLPSLIAFLTTSSDTAVVVSTVTGETQGGIAPSRKKRRKQARSRAQQQHTRASDSDNSSSDADSETRFGLRATGSKWTAESFSVVKTGGYVVQVNLRIDFTNRPAELENVNLYTFVCEYNKTPIYMRRRPSSNSDSDAGSDSDHSMEDTTDTMENTATGRPAMNRLPFLPAHPQADTHQLCCRGTRVDQQYVPVMKGLYIPSRRSADKRDLYSLLMLLLLKPWRTAADLLAGEKTWSAAFDKWNASLTSDSNERNQMDRFELLHVCAEEKEKDKQRMIEDMQAMLAEPNNQTDSRSERNKQETTGDADVSEADADKTGIMDIDELSEEVAKVRPRARVGWKHGI